jgi:hypothetical protein
LPFLHIAFLPCFAFFAFFAFFFFFLPFLPFFAFFNLILLQSGYWKPMRIIFQFRFVQKLESGRLDREQVTAEKGRRIRLIIIRIGNRILIRFPNWVIFVRKTNQETPESSYCFQDEL